MCPVADGKVVVTVFQHPGPLRTVFLYGIFVIARKVGRIELDRNFFRCTGFENTCLSKGNKLYSSLFQPACLVRSLYIELHNTLACYITRVGNGGFCRAGTTHIDLDGIEFLLKCGVGKAVAERIGNFVLIDPFIAGSSCGRGGICLADHSIFITGLIILVAVINAFRFNQIPVALVIVDQHIITAAAVGIIGVKINTEIHHSGSRIRTNGERITQVSGRIYSSFEHICHTQEAIHTRFTDPDDGSDAFVILEVFNLDGVVGIHQHNHFCAVFFCQLNHRFLIGGQCQRAVIGIRLDHFLPFFDKVLHLGVVVRRFGTVTGKDDDCNRTVSRGKNIIRVDLSRCFADVVCAWIFIGFAE